jgi:hypothetical protein
MEQSTLEIGQHGPLETPEVGCLGGVSIPCRPVSPTVGPISRSGKRYGSYSRSVCQERLNDWYETSDSVRVAQKKVLRVHYIDRCNDHKLCGKLMGGGKGKKDVNAKLTTNFINIL